MKSNLLDKAKNTAGKVKGMSKKKKIISAIIAVAVIILVAFGAFKAFGGKKAERAYHKRYGHNRS